MIISDFLPAAACIQKIILIEKYNGNGFQIETFGEDNISKNIHLNSTTAIAFTGTVLYALKWQLYFTTL